MRVTLFLSTLLLFFGFTSPPGTEPDKAASEADSYNYAEDFIASMSNCELEKRFEVQFSDLIADVTQINVHRDQRNIYYYAVYGVNQEGDAMVEYFKTTEEEVLEEKYNFIEMNENTMQNLGARRWCRDDGSFPFRSGNWCSPNYSGVVCGIATNYGCIIF